MAEHRDGRLEETTLEVLGEAIEVAQATDLVVRVAVLGSDTAALAEGLSAYPVEEVLTVQDERLTPYSPEGYSAVLRHLLEDLDVVFVLVSHTATGYEFLPRAAGELGKVCITDAVEVGREDGKAVVTRMGFNGKVAVELAVADPTPCLVTLRPGVGKPPEPTGTTAAVRSVDIDLSSLTVHREVLGYEKPVSEDVDIAEADVVVAAGRGIKEKENLKLVEDLAEALGGVVAGSRPLIDKEWLPWSRQVGSSGKTVRPKLYVACGISGAMQHLTGMKNAQTIVAINIDPTAPIFGVAHYGVVGDLFKVIPALLKGLGRG